MNVIRFFKEKWNVVSGFAVTIAAVLTKFIAPPEFPNILSLGDGIDYGALSKFIILGLVLILLVPFQLFKRKKHMGWWWVLGLLSLIGSMVMLISYNNARSNKTAFNKDSHQHEIIGVHLLPLARAAVNIQKKALHTDSIPNDMILTRLGPADEIWPKSEISANARDLLLSYLSTITIFTLFILFAIQALYCSTKAR